MESPRISTYLFHCPDGAYFGFKVRIHAINNIKCLYVALIKYDLKCFTKRVLWTRVKYWISNTRTPEQRRQPHENCCATVSVNTQKIETGANGMDLLACLCEWVSDCVYAFECWKVYNRFVFVSHITIQCTTHWHKHVIAHWHKRAFASNSCHVQSFQRNIYKCTHTVLILTSPLTDWKLNNVQTFIGHLCEIEVWKKSQIAIQVET